jgi:glycosyltransferase involved in cell wall biosynthesis
MKILQVSSAKTFGGGERHLVDLCKGLIKRGHEVFVVVRPTCEWLSRLDFLPKGNIFQVSIRNSIGIFSAQRIAGFIRKNNIQIAHAHVARDYFPISLACRIAKTPKFIITRHVLFPLKAFNRFALKNLSQAIAVSQGVEWELKKLFPFEKIITISNGVEIERFAGADHKKLRQAFRFEQNIPFDAPLVTTVGELKPLKGQEDFILAAQIVAQKFPEAHFAIIGKDNSLDQTFRRKVKRLVKVFELEDRFLWLNWVEETPVLFHATDVYVSPSHSESFGLAILEAMTSGCAVVATETAGAKELLGSEKLVPIEKPAQLAERIGEFLADRKKREEFGKMAQERAKENFNLEKMIEKIEVVYQKVLDKPATL